MLRTLRQRLASNNFSLLVAAAILHVLTTTSIYLTGRFQFARGIVDANGIGLPSSSDCIPYRLQTIALVEALTHEGVWAWLNVSAPLHIKLYSLVFSVSRYFFGFTILGAEPINLLLYLVIIVLVFKIAREAFDRRTALLAAATVAVWPSFLLHTTQFLKEPLFIAGMLALVYIGLTWTTKTYTWRYALFAGGAAGGVANILLAVRIDMWMLVLAALLIPCSLFALQQLSRKRFALTNTIGIILALALFTGVPLLFINLQWFETPPEVSRASGDVTTQGSAQSAPTATATGAGLYASVESQVLLRRQRFLEMYPDAGSNIDPQVRPVSIISYLLRATVVGFFAPFPTMWQEGREVGRAGGLLAGAETLCMYLVQCLAFYALMREPRRISSWLLVLVAAASLVALGFAVANAGALYRMRYAFFMLLIVLGARGLYQVRFDILRRTRQSVN